jgi:hypothetical protein
MTAKTEDYQKIDILQHLFFRCSLKDLKNIELAFVRKEINQGAEKKGIKYLAVSK